MKEEIPGCEEVISYNIPAFQLNGETVMHFAGWKKHISLYPFTSEMANTFPETANYNTSGKGTIQFPLDQELPWKLISKIVQYQVRDLSNT